MQKVEIKLLESYKELALPIPAFAKIGDAGIDLRNSSNYCFEISNNKVSKIPTGLSVSIPENHCGMVLERSGFGAKYGTVIHGKIIDSGYRGEIFILLSSIIPFTVNPADRVAQMVIIPVVTSIAIVEKLNNTVRNISGFGSSGVK